MSQLWSPTSIGIQALENRIVIPPMCTYTAENGLPADWHYQHYGALSHSGAGLLIMEATGVCPQGRISPFDLGLWSPQHGAAMGALIQSIRKYSAMPIAVQLQHAGRKASTAAPWMGDGGYLPPEQGGWQPVAPSAIDTQGRTAGQATELPRALDDAGIRDIIEQFAQAAQQADKAGIDMIELHGAHGYLIHQFLSPLSNQRTDEWGGGLEKRMRFALEVFRAVRVVFPRDKAVGIRVSATDWVAGGWDLPQAIELAQALDALGCSFIHVSSGGLDNRQQIPAGPSYQVPFAQAIKGKVRMPVIAVGMITEPVQAEAIIRTGQADMVAVGRAMLFDPHWPWHAAVALGGKVTVPPQYLRSASLPAQRVFK